MNCESLRTSDLPIENDFCIKPAVAFSQYGNMVYRLALMRTRNQSDADDVVQEVFLRLLKNTVKIVSEDHLKAWLIRTAINCSKSLLGSAYNQKTIGLNDTLYTEMKEESEVYYAVLALSKKYRTAVHLYYYEGFSVIEIAGMTGSTESAVKQRLHRARTMLSSVLKGELFDV